MGSWYSIFIVIGKPLEGDEGINLANNGPDTGVSGNRNRYSR